MTNQSLCPDLIERYLSTCGLRSLRGDHEGEYFCVVNTRSGRMHVRLEISPSFGDVLAISVTPARSFAIADRPWLTRFADTWNKQNHGVTAIVQRSSDPRQIGLSARNSQWIREGISFEDFGAAVDRTLAAAIDLYAELTPAFQSPSTAQPLLRDAG